MTAAGCSGPMRQAPAFSRERVVFGRPISQNQSIQHPLASVWMRLQFRRALRSGQALRAPGQYRAHPRRIGSLRSGVPGGAHPWRLWLRAGISRRAVFPRKRAALHRAGQRGTDPLLRGRESAGDVQVLLTLDWRVAVAAASVSAIAYMCDLVTASEWAPLPH